MSHMVIAVLVEQIKPNNLYLGTLGFAVLGDGLMVLWGESVLGRE
jgi:hypothetical protein